MRAAGTDSLLVQSWNADQAFRAARAALEFWGRAGAQLELRSIGDNAVFRALAAGEEPILLRVTRPGLVSLKHQQILLAAVAYVAESGVATEQPAALPALELEGSVISAWAELPSADAGTSPAELGVILRRLHSLPTAGVMLPRDWGELRRGRWRLEQAKDLIGPDGVRVLAAAFDHAEQALAQDQGPVVILHGDAHPGNLLSSSGSAYLLDWEHASLGPAQLELLLPYLCWRELEPDRYREFCYSYGADLRDWAPLEPVLAARELTTALFHLLSPHPERSAQGRERIAALLG